jgi:hypothetical protein
VDYDIGLPGGGGSVQKLHIIFHDVLKRNGCGEVRPSFGRV